MPTEHPIYPTPAKVLVNKAELRALLMVAAEARYLACWADGPRHLVDALKAAIAALDEAKEKR